MYTEKQQAVLKAAKGVFLRYGYKRVTMNDLASAAHISRPGLYLMFPGKEEVFLGVARAEQAEMLGAIRDGIGTRTTLTEKLRYAFDIWAIRPFEMISETAEARELFECEFDFAKEAAEEANVGFEAILAEILKDSRVSLPRGLTPERAAHVLRCASYGFKRQASTVVELQAVIDDMITFLESSFGEEPLRLPVGYWLQP